jgi:hypothetical protein
MVSTEEVLMRDPGTVPLETVESRGNMVLYNLEEQKECC